MIIWSFLLYYFGIVSTKAFLDRLPNDHIDIHDDGTNDTFTIRTYPHQRHILISLRLRLTKGNYDSLFQQFELMFHDRLTKIIRPEGELFRVPALSRRIDEYLSM